MAIAADGDPCAWPVPTDAPHQPAQMGADFLAVRCLAGTQDGEDAMAGVGIVDMDRHEAAFVIVSVEQRQLLMAMHGIGRVIDIEGNRLWWAPVAVAPQVHHGVRQPDQGAQVGRVLPARQGGLRGQVIAALGKPPAGQFECRVLAQIVQVIAIRIAPRLRRGRLQRSRRCARAECRSACG